MQTTDLTTKDSDINVILGDYTFWEDPRQEAFGSLKYLYTDLSDIRKYYIRLGFHLYEFKGCEYYKDFGYQTLEDFCDVNLGLDKGTVSRCINVYKEFNASNDLSYNGGGKTIGCAMDLSEKWKDFSYTQLCEMLPLTEYDRKQITPDMTVKQIREYKKSLRDEERRSKELDKGLKFLNEVIQKSKDPVVSTQLEDLPDDTAVSTQLFDFDEYENRKGIVRYNYVKKCDPVKEGRNRQLYVFDNRGKEVIFDDQCDILLNDDGEIVIRLYYPAKPVEWDEENNE